MSYEYPSLDHSIIHFSAHSARIRIVTDDEAESALSLLQMLFPHEPVLRLPLPCRHTCLYTHSASAADIAEQVAQHSCTDAREPL
jgi:hypothetical protein